MNLNILNIVTLSRVITEKEFPTLARLAKTTEELGEFSESTLVQLGYLKHKTLKEPQAGELADVIITAVDTYIASNPGIDLLELVQDLQEQLKIKYRKWEALYI